MLSVDTIKKTRRREFVAIPAWTPEGQEHDPAKHGVYVGAMGARALLAYESEIQTRLGGVDSSEKMTPEHQAEVLAAIAVLVVQDENGGALFTRDDAEWLVNEPLEALTAISDAAMRLSGLAVSQTERAKNCNAGPGSDLLSDSPAISA